MYIYAYWEPLPALNNLKDQRWIPPPNFDARKEKSTFVLPQISTPILSEEKLE